MRTVKKARAHRKKRCGMLVGTFLCLSFFLTALFPPCQVAKAKSFIEICTAQGITLVAVSSDNSEDNSTGSNFPPSPVKKTCSYCLAQSFVGNGGLSNPLLPEPETSSSVRLSLQAELFAEFRTLFPAIQGRAPPVLS